MIFLLLLFPDFQFERSHLSSRVEEGIADIGEQLKMSFKNDYFILFYLNRQMAASPFAPSQEQ